MVVKLEHADLQDYDQARLGSFQSRVAERWALYYMIGSAGDHKNQLVALIQTRLMTFISLAGSLTGICKVSVFERDASSLK